MEVTMKVISRTMWQMDMAGISMSMATNIKDNGRITSQMGRVRLNILTEVGTMASFSTTRDTVRAC